MPARSPSTVTMGAATTRGLLGWAVGHARRWPPRSLASTRRPLPSPPAWNVMDREATSAQVRLLGDLLGRTIADIEGQDQLDLVERVRALSVAQQRGDDAAGAELT